MQKTLNEIMTEKVITLHEEDSLKKAFELLGKHGILGAPVVDGAGKVVGMITESDLIEPLTTLHAPKSLNLLGSMIYLENAEDFNSKLKEHCARTVGDLMTREVICLPLQATLMEAVDLMAERHLSRLPVIGKDGALAGIVTRSDVVRQLVKLKNL